MVRRPALLATLVAAAIAANLAAGAGLAVWSEGWIYSQFGLMGSRTSSGQIQVSSSARAWVTSTGSRPATPDKTFTLESILCSVTAQQADGADGRSYFVQTMKTGWPMKCFEQTRSGSTAGTGRSPIPSWKPGEQPSIPIPWYRGSAGRVHMPLGIRWAAMLSNLVFYSLSLYALTIWLPMSAAGIIRRRTGRCVHCAHQLNGARFCPECGELSNNVNIRVGPVFRWLEAGGRIGTSAASRPSERPGPPA